MKKSAIPVLLLLHLLYPLCLLAAALWGVEFTLSSDLWYMLLLTAATVWLTCVAEPNRAAMGLFPVTVIDGLCAVCCTWCLPAAVCAVCWCVCGGYLFHRFVGKGVGKILTLIPTVLLIVALALSCPIDLFAEAMRSVTVVREVDSPDGVYTALVIDADYGATGGDTLVRVYDNTQTVNLLFGRFAPESELGYRGEWGEFYDLEVSWDEGHILTIDGKSRIICSGSGVIRSIYLGQTDVDEPLLAALSKSRATRLSTIQDHPDEEILRKIDLDTTTLYLYEKNGKLYIEQPYNGIWEADESLMELLT